MKQIINHIWNLHKWQWQKILGNSKFVSRVQSGKSQQHKNKIDKFDERVKQKSNDRQKSKFVEWVC